MFKELIIKFVPETFLWKYRRSDFYQNKLVKVWDSPGNTHRVKEESIIELQNKFNCEFFIETGTSSGEMPYKLKSYFKYLITIELDINLFHAAKWRLRKYSNIEFLHGDSGKVLQKIVNRISGPAIFWLDGHYSGGSTARADKDTPIEEELNTILNQPLNHIILIDDAECFGHADYPDYPTLMKITDLVKIKKPDYTFEVCGDIIRAYKNN